MISFRSLVPLVVMTLFVGVIAHVVYFVAIPIGGLGGTLFAVGFAAVIALGLALAFSHEPKAGH